jgi:hypothetical protein
MNGRRECGVAIRPDAREMSTTDLFATRVQMSAWGAPEQRKLARDLKIKEDFPYRIGRSSFLD